MLFTASAHVKTKKDFLKMQSSMIYITETIEQHASCSDSNALSYFNRVLISPILPNASNGADNIRYSPTL